jgi:hypothetical protein
VYYLQDVINRPFFNETILQTDSCHSGIAVSACTDAGSLARKKPKPFADFDVLTIDQSINRPACSTAPSSKSGFFLTGGCVIPARPSSTGGTHECRIDRCGLTHIAQVLRDAILMRCAIAALAPPVIS